MYASPLRADVLSLSMDVRSVHILIVGVRHPSVDNLPIKAKP